jgi:hypothetical protein
MEQAISGAEKSQREAESLLKKMDAEERAENLEERGTQPLSKAVEEIRDEVF